jgi:hypothetical protein
MKQLKISLPADFRARLDAAIAASGRSLADEIRTRVERTFLDDAVDKSTRGLQDFVSALATLVRLETDHDWHAHPFAHLAMRRGLTARLARLKPAGDPVLGPDDRRHFQFVASDDPDEIGLGLEAIEARSAPADDPRVLQLVEETSRELREIHRKNMKGQKR